MPAFLDHLLSLYLDAAPWLVFGLAAAGLLQAWVPEAALQRWIGGSGSGAITRAALIGAPLPLCSCGVLPAALGLRRAGASRGATVSFLIATPETGPDSVAISYALLGPFMAVLRPIAAVLSAISAGLLTAWLAPERPGQTAESLAAEATGGSCCSSHSCCADDQPAPGEPGTIARSIAGLRYAFTTMLDDLALWLAIGLVLAAAVATWVPPLVMAQWGSGLLPMLGMLAVGIPMYICATASTPVAAALLLAGLSPGTVLVFLLAGPATNIATMGIVRREMGGRTLAAYLLGISLASLGLGLLTDALVAHYGIDIAAQLVEGTDLVPIGLAWASASLLAAMVLANGLLRHRATAAPTKI